ncbi:efflux RND transporter permease subunit [Candidatus Methylacidiphilum infernorum]|uniref:Efflux RND transporter permease subunit n=1 Tax=Candidatus Methylacidiphilum infernorum TaxID=511746 RepID=A0ABX7PYW6_9BACT|nr:CusA/CzcA family heavy metal efflux RND transporter [Candidatus Methylacidiphilum infernorum]QSR87746.1 efflux RND transporter permease subunit [Candidatus Methylacidiphilum infernorum]
MLERFIAMLLKNKPVVLLGLFFYLGVALYTAFHLSIDVVPDISSVQVQVMTPVRDYAPEEIEKLVTFPLERECSGIPGLEEMRSVSKFGISQLTLIFRDGTDIYRARQLTSERLLTALDKIPPGLVPRMGPMSTGLGEVFVYALDWKEDAPSRPPSEFERLVELKLIQQYQIIPQLRMVPGVVEINTLGGYDKEILVMPDPQKLMNLGLTLKDLADVVGMNVENVGGAYVTKAGEQMTVRAASRVEEIRQIQILPIKYPGYVKPVLVEDVAAVQEGAKIRVGAALKNGKETVLGIILMRSGENGRTVSQRVFKKIREIQSRLPEGVNIEVLYNRSEFTDQVIHTAFSNLLEGATLVTVILFFILADFRAALIVSFTIPLSFLFALLGMKLCRLSGNLMSLGAIDFGLIVDGAVIMVENILRKLSQGESQTSPSLAGKEKEKVVQETVTEVGPSVFIGVLIITFVYVPILSLGGVAGKTFRPMALTVIFAMVGSIIFSFTAVPVLAVMGLGSGKASRRKQDWLVRMLQKIYRPFIRFTLNKGWFFSSSALLVFVIAVMKFATLGADFVPKLDEGAYDINIFRENTIGLEASVAMEKETEKILLESFPEIRYVYSRIGMADIATDPASPNEPELYIFLKPKSQWRKINGKVLSKEDLEDLIEEEIKLKVPGQAMIFSQPIENRFNEMLQGIKADVAFKVFGSDYGTIYSLTEALKKLLEKVRGVVGLAFESSGVAPSLEVIPDRLAMARFNVQSAEINGAVSAALGGKTVGQLINGVRRFDIVVRFSDQQRQNLNALLSLPVRSGTGGLLYLSQLASARYAERLRSISRENGLRRIALLVDLERRDMESFVREATDKIAKELHFPQGYYYEIGGQYKNYLEAKETLKGVVPVAALAIVLLLYFLFKNFRHCFIVCFSIPLAVTGGIFSLLFSGLSFSISAWIGFIAVSGVAILEGLVLLGAINRCRSSGLTLVEAIEEGALMRLRPVLATALVASLGFVPMAIAHGPGAEVQRPLALVVIGGIVSSTLLDLVVLPVFYLWIEEAWNWWQKRSSP